LISISKNSLPILEINFKLLEYNLQKKVEYEVFFHWLYVLRIFEIERNFEGKKIIFEFLSVYYDTLRQSGLDMKYSVLVSDIFQEYILSDMIAVDE